MSDLCTLSLAELQAAMAKGDCKPTQAVRASLEAIEKTDSSLHAAITVNAEAALATANQYDNDLATVDFAQKPLFGVPVTVKDVFCTQGLRTTCGSKMLETFIPPYDAHVVERLKNAGAIIVAKTNMDEFAMGSSTEFSAYGKTANPWDISRVPGGSSGGSAASVASRQVFGSLGSDTGGSIRQPASFCGCVGVKPTYGRVSRYGMVAYASSFDQAGVFARSTRDCATLLQAIAGYDPKDATCSPLEVQDFSSGFGRKDLKGITIGLPTEFWEQGLSDEVGKACNNAVAMAKELGATVVETSMPLLKYSVATYYILASAEASTNLARFDGVRYGLRDGEEQGLVDMYIASRSKGFGMEVKRRILLGTYALSAGYYDAYYKKASQVRRKIAEEYERALSHCDMLFAPVSPVTAWKFDEFIDDPLTSYKMDILTLSLNLAGLPGMSLPVGLGHDSKMPVGLQIIGKPFDEANMLAYASVLENALPSLGLPDIHA